jgi:hypothetical protein
MWEEREMRKPPSQRKPLPQPPQDLPLSATRKAIDEHNALVYESFNQNVMVRCPNCFRTFLEDRIEVHLKSCTSENPHKIAPSAAKIPEIIEKVKTYAPIAPKSPVARSGYDKMNMKPRALMCHIW